MAGGKMHAPHPTPLYPPLAMSCRNHQKSLAYFSHWAPLILYFFFTKRQRRGMAQLHTDTFQTSQTHSQRESTIPFIRAKFGKFFSHPQLGTAAVHTLDNRRFAIRRNIYFHNVCMRIIARRLKLPTYNTKQQNYLCFLLHLYPPITRKRRRRYA